MIMIPESQDALVVLDAHRRVRRISNHAAALLGAGPRELVGRPWESIDRPEGLVFTARIQTLEGRRRRDRLHLITLAACREEGRHAELVEAWEDSVELALVRAPDGHVLAVNSAFARKFGVAAPRWMGRDADELLHPDDLKDWKRTVTMLARPPYRVSHEHRWMTAQGWRWLAWEETALRDDAGTVFAYRAIGRDVTKRRLAEEHFFKLASLVDQSPLSVVLTMPDGRVEYVNPRYTQVSGYTLEEIFERRIEVLRTGLGSEAEYASMLRAVREGGKWRGELCVRTKGGRDLWEAVQLSAIRDQQDQISHLLCLREDITERKLLEDQLRQAQKMEILGTLAGGISHDFNNLLAIISGFCEMALMKAPETGEVHRYLGEIHMATRRATGLVKQILGFSRKHEPEMEAVNVNRLAKDLGRLFSETFPRTISFDYDIDPMVPAVTGDQDKLQQVIMNLCVNARDAMPDGGQITLRTHRQPGTGIARLGGDPDLQYACIEVQDTGQGMTPEVRARIFEPFFTTKAKNRGTGLGLAVVFGIVKSHGGMLDVISSPGHGTTFKVYLPVAAEEDEAVAGVTMTSAAIPPGRETLLVVEDEPGLRRLLVSAFSEAGYKVHCAADGAEAVSFLLGRSETLHAVLLDLNLPEVTGMQVRNLLLRTRPATRIIIVSGQVPPELRIELERAGDAVVMGKPCNLSELGRVLRHQLDRTPAANVVASA